MNLDKYDAITRRVGGEDGFMVASNYRKLEEKYRRWHVSRKKLAILNDMRRQWCKE